MQKRPDILVKNNVRYFQKHTVHQRVQSIIQIGSVLVLALTGLPLRYAEYDWAVQLYTFFGGPEVAPNIHRAAGTILVSVFIYHTVYWMVKLYVNDIRYLIKDGNLNFKTFLKAFLSQAMIMDKADFKSVADHFKYIFFITNKPAQYDRIMWKDKFEYYAQYWGITVIGLAGLALWWRDEVSHILPGIVFNAAYIMHSYEALLAVLFLFFIHWYHEYYCPEKFPIPTGFFSGYVSENQMIHEHYARYEKLMTEAGLDSEIKKHH